MTATAPPPTPTSIPADRHRHVIVVVDQPCAAPELCELVRARDGVDLVEALVIAPSHGGPETQWYVDEDAARAEATHRLRACVACLARDGIRASGHLSDPDPVQAIADALHEFPADEILFVSAPQRPSGRLRRNAIDRARHRFHQPVEHIVMPAVPSTRRIVHASGGQT